MGDVKLNIAFFGYNSNELIEVIKSISCQLTNFAITGDKFDDIELKGFFEKEILFKNKTRSINIMVDFPKSKEDYDDLLKNFEIDTFEIKRYLKKKFKKDIDYYFFLYNEKIKFLIEYLISISNNNYCLITENNVKLNCEIIKNNIISSIEDSTIDEKVFKFFEQIYNAYPKFKEFLKVSKEKYYNKFNKYFRRYIDLNSKNEIELFGIFNSFELYSFDSIDFNDDSIIILQILCNRNCKNFYFGGEKFLCDKCNKNMRSSYNKKQKLFLCAKCNPQSYNNNNLFNLNMVKCENCNVLINKDQISLYIINFCCNKCYCSSCIKKKIIEQIKTKKGKIKCFCGEIIFEDIIENIIGDDYQKIFNNFDN